MLLSNHVDSFEQKKIKIIKYWLNNKKIIKIIKNYNIESEAFIKKIALPLLESKIKIIKKEISFEDCDACKDFLKFLKNNELSLSDTFLIYNGLKDAFFEIIYDLKISSYLIEKELNTLFEQDIAFLLANFEKISLDEETNESNNLEEKNKIDFEKEFKEQQKILIEQSKAAAMGEMISMIAHQWRQPLQAVSILTQKLTLSNNLDGKISDELLEQVVGDISSQLEYMSKTIDDFREFFLPNKQKEMILLSDLVNKAVEFTAFMIKNDSIDLKIQSNSDEEVFIYVNEFIQVMINIIKNAKDVLNEKELETKEINITYEIVEDKAIVQIEDNAGGIPEDIIYKIFEPYFSTKQDKNGTGLGLYMSKTIIERHCKGSLEASNSSKGALFKVTVPLS